MLYGELNKEIAMGITVERKIVEGIPVNGWKTFNVTEIIIHIPVKY